MAKSVRTTGKKRTKKSSSKVAKVKSKSAFRSYQKAIDYLFERTDYEKEENLRYNVTTFSLDRMKKLLSFFVVVLALSFMQGGALAVFAAEEPTTWRYATFLTKKRVEWNLVEFYKKNVFEKTKGQVNVALYPGLSGVASSGRKQYSAGCPVAV